MDRKTQLIIAFAVAFLIMIIGLGKINRMASKKAEPQLKAFEKQAIKTADKLIEEKEERGASPKAEKTEPQTAVIFDVQTTVPEDSPPVVPEQEKLYPDVELPLLPGMIDGMPQDPDMFPPELYPPGYFPEGPAPSEQPSEY